MKASNKKPGTFGTRNTLLAAGVGALMLAGFGHAVADDVGSVGFQGNVTGITGNSSWASDLRMDLTAPDGAVYSVGGLTNAAPVDWDFDGSGSTDDGFYEHFDGTAFNPPVGIEGTWNVAFRNDWDSASAATMSWTGVEVSIGALVEGAALEVFEIPDFALGQMEEIDFDFVVAGDPDPPPPDPDPVTEGVYLEIVQAQPGEQVATDIGYLQVNDLRAFTTEILYNPNLLTPEVDGASPPNVIGCLANPGGNWSADFTGCNLAQTPAEGGRIILTISSGLAVGSPPIAGADPFGSITWTVNPNAEPGQITVMSFNTTFAAASGSSVNDPSLLPTRSGQVTIFIDGQGYGSTPPSGSTIDLGAALVGSTTGASVLTVSSVGNVDLEIDTMTIVGDQYDVVPDPSGTTIPVGESVDLDVTCTPDARGQIADGTVTIANQSVNIPEATYTLQCAGLAPLVTVTDPDPASVTVLALPGGDSASGTGTISEAGDAFSTSVQNITYSVDGPVLGPTVTATGPATLAAGATADYTVTCEADDTSVEGTFQYDVTISWDNPDATGTSSAVVGFECEVIAALPIYTSDPAVGATLDFGVVTNGVESDPIGIDVTNQGEGPSPDSDLQITAASADNAIFDVSFDGSVILVNATLQDAITVTCTPEAVGLVTATLTVNTNDPNEPAEGFQYTLECTGESDAAFSSDPEAGGVLNLGVVTPQAQTPPGDIVFFNNGEVDSLTVSCTFDDAGGVFSVSPDPVEFTIAPGDSATATFQCVPPTPDSFTGTLSCDIGGLAEPLSVEYSVVCQGEPLVVPTMSRWGLIIMALVLLAFAGFGGRRFLAART